jgi:hypothetical protein
VKMERPLRTRSGHVPRLIAKIVAQCANRLRLLQWFWRLQLFATRRLTTDRHKELCKYRSLSSQRICSGRFSFGVTWLNSAKRASCFRGVPQGGSLKGNRRILL